MAGRAWASFRGIPGALWVLYADTFTMALGFYMLIPLLAYHLLENLALSVAVVGALAAVRSASQQGLMPWSGWLADRMDYRRAIAVGVLVRAAGFGMLGAAQSIPALVVACVLTGLGGSLFHPASYAAYSALARGRDHVSVYSARETLSNLGFVLGPALGGTVAAAVDFRWLCYGSAGLFGIAFVVTVAGLPAGLSRSAGGRPVRLRAVAGHRAFVRYCLFAAGVWVLISQLYLAVPVLARAVLPDAIGIGAVYSAGAIVMVTLTLPLTRLARRRWHTRQILVIGVTGLGSGLAVMGLWESAAGLFAGIALFTVGQIFSQPVMNAVVAGYAREGGVASYFGVHGLAHAVGGVIGNVGGGFLYGLRDGWSILPWVIFACWALALALLLHSAGRLR